MQIAVITHPIDTRIKTTLFGHVLKSAPRYQVDAVIIALRQRGHTVFHTDVESPFRAADAAILHVDMTEMDAATMALVARYPRCLNGGVQSIAKRVVSRNLVTRGDGWAGPVIVKSNLNCKAGSELRLNNLAVEAGMPRPFDRLARFGPYQVHDHADLVPLPVWDNPYQVVERFLPERRDGGYTLRVWSFLGEYERCNWYVGPDPVVKAGKTTGHGPSEIPDEIRAARQRLGFDYGKFDFAITPAGPVLYDANLTPGFLVSRPEVMRRSALPMARAFLDWCARPPLPAATGDVAARQRDSYSGA